MLVLLVAMLSGLAFHAVCLGDHAVMRTVTLIGAATSAGGYAPGQEDGPRALLDAGLVERLEPAGVEMRRGGQVKPSRWHRHA